MNKLWCISLREKSITSMPILHSQSWHSAAWLTDAISVHSRKQSNTWLTATSHSGTELIVTQPYFSAWWQLDCPGVILFYFFCIIYILFYVCLNVCKCKHDYYIVFLLNSLLAWLAPHAVGANIIHSLSVLVALLLKAQSFSIWRLWLHPSLLSPPSYVSLSPSESLLDSEP